MRVIVAWKIVAAPALVALLAFGSAGSGRAEAGNGLYQKTAGIEAYVGLVPAEITKGHDGTARRGSMHGGVPEGGYQYHLVAALFDANTGARITDASVAAQVSSSSQAGPKTVLETMTIAETTSYGGYVVVAGPGPYSITLSVKRSGQPVPVTLIFRLSSAPR
jgi:hypothetical protein